jgi:DinB family
LSTLTQADLESPRTVDADFYTLGEFVQHVLNHSTYHRGQVTVPLRQLATQSLPPTTGISSQSRAPGSNPIQPIRPRRHFRQASYAAASNIRSRLLPRLSGPKTKVPFIPTNILIFRPAGSLLDLIAREARNNRRLIEVALLDRHVFPYDQPVRRQFE